MGKREEFVNFIEAQKAISPTITDQQRKGLLRLAKREYGLTTDEAMQIIKDSGLVVGELENYFDVLGLSMEKMQGLSESNIAKMVEDAHKKLYEYANMLGGGQDHKTGLSSDELRNLLNEARDTLKDPQKRKEHIAALKHEEELTKEPVGTTRPILKFPSGDEAKSIPQLATLMEKNSREATEALYRGYVEQSLGSAGEIHYADAARAVVSQYPDDGDLGLRVLIQILHGKMRFSKGGEASTPKQIAQLIDRNWEEGKDYLYNGFMALWLKYAQHKTLAETADRVTNRYKDDRDIGLEIFVQRLYPQIGQPKLETNHAEIDFGTVDGDKVLKGSYTKQFTIKNSGRGHLYGEITTSESWLTVDKVEFSGNSTTVTITAKDTGRSANITIQSNGGVKTLPVTMNFVYPIWKPILSLKCLIGAGVGLGLDYLLTYFFLISAPNPIRGIVMGFLLGLVISMSKWVKRIKRSIFYLIPVASLLFGIGIPTYTGYQEYKIRTAKSGDVWVVEPLVKALKYNYNSTNRRRAAEALGQIGTEAVEPLIKMLGDEDSNYYAAVALGKMGTEAVEPLIKALEDGDHLVRLYAARALGKIGTRVTKVVELLISALGDEELDGYAVIALGYTGDRRAVEPLIKVLEDKDSGVRVSAAVALGKIGDRRAVEPLIKALEDEDYWMRRHAAEALGKIGGKRAVESLIKALGDKHSSVRVYAAFALGDIGTEAVEPLIEALGDSRYDAAFALYQIGTEAVKPLIKALRDKDPRVRMSAVQSLKTLGKIKYASRELRKIKGR